MDTLKLDPLAQQVGSCSCLTKTPEAKWHDPFCYSRLLDEKMTVPADLRNKLSPISTFLQLMDRDENSIPREMIEDAGKRAQAAFIEVIEIVNSLDRRL